MHQTLVACRELAGHLNDPNWVVVDCRFSLDVPDRGRKAYHDQHIPGAVYAHLNEDLSGPIVRGRTGRHPLPTIEQVSQTLSRWGIDDRVQVVAYDDASGAIAARLWWILRWLGHKQAAVLNGGFPRWIQEGHPVRSGDEQPAARTFRPRPCPELVVEATDVRARILDTSWRIIDSRVPERFRGEKEPIDPVAGRIPGAVNAPHVDNVAADGLFKDPEELRKRFLTLVGDTPANRTVFYCGSGVTAAHNALAYEHAGLGAARLYAGSWSEWITDPSRPMERG